MNEDLRRRPVKTGQRLVLGRKNWLIAGNPDGTKTRASFFSLIETAKANGLEPYGKSFKGQTET